jgi:hypothetical protein
MLILRLLHSILNVMTQLDPDLSVELSFIGILMANKIRNANDREQLYDNIFSIPKGFRASALD